MSDTDDELEKLREQTDPGTRAEAESEEPEDDLEDAIVDVLGSIEAGETSKTLSVRDDRLAALILGLEDTAELDGIGKALNANLEQTDSDEDFDRSEVIRLAIRVGLNEAAPEVVETARDAYGRHAAENF
jgi:hypothetical protein